MSSNPSQTRFRQPDQRFRPWVRSMPVRTMFRPNDYGDLQVLSEAWSVPLATTVWLIVAERLARYRQQSAELGPLGLAAAASAATLGLVVAPGIRAERRRQAAARDWPRTTG